MTGVEGGNIERVKTKREKELPLTEDGKEEILTKQEKKFVEIWGQDYEKYICAMKRVEEAKQNGEIPSSLLEDYLMVEKKWPTIGFLLQYGEMYKIIGETVMDKMGLRSELRAAELAIKYRKRKMNFFESFIKDLDKIREILKLTTPWENLTREFSETFTAFKAIDRVVASLPEEKRKVYEKKFLEERMKLSTAINIEMEERLKHLEK